MSIRVHPSIRTAVMLWVILAICLGWLYHEKTRWAGTKRAIQMQDEGSIPIAPAIANDLIRYLARNTQPSQSTQPGSALLETIDGRLNRLGLSDAIREVQPQSPRLIRSIRIEEIRLRISPINASRLGELLDVFESGDPAIRVARYEIVRIEKDADTLDVMFHLQQWFQSGVASN